MKQNMKIGEVAKASSVSIETIRYYERCKLLPKPPRTASGYRMYGEETLQQLAFVRRAQRLGFSLDEIARLLDLQKGGGKAEVRELAREKLALVEEKLCDLQNMQVTLKGLVDRCSGKGRVEGCPIIQALAEGDKRIDEVCAHQHFVHINILRWSNPMKHVQSGSADCCKPQKDNSTPHEHCATGATDKDQGHHAGHGGASRFGTVTSATIHCLTGCVIGEVAGLAIGVASGCRLYTLPSWPSR